MDAEVLKLGSGMIIGGAAAVILSGYFPGTAQGDISSLGWLAFILGSLIVALAVIEER
ncbi:MAG: hypothetical protein ABEK00_03415 [Candidatus Nanohaloarchaea archaeon]